MSENIIAISLLENCEKFAEQIVDLAKEQGQIVNTRLIFIQGLLESSVDSIVKATRSNEDVDSAKFLACNLLKSEIEKFINQKSTFDQTLGKLVVTNEITKYIKDSLAAENEKKQAELNKEKAEARVKERIEVGDNLDSKSRNYGEHPEKLKNIRDLQESEKS
jgi:hypothetical protein